MSDDAATTIRVGHSPDSDDAFMFYALTHDKLDTGGLRFVHQLEDIETLNQRALKRRAGGLGGQHPCVCPPGRSLRPARLGLEHGRPVRADARHPRADDRSRICKGATIAVPGKLTTAYLTMQLCLGKDVPVVVMPFDQILPAVAEGRVEAGLLIHEGQLYYGDRGLHKVVDLGAWWYEQTGLAAPAGRQRRPQGPGRGDGRRGSPGCSRRASATPSTIARRPSTMPCGTPADLEPALADRFVGMYVNDWTHRLRAEGTRGGAHPARPRGGSGFSPGPLDVQFVG